MVVQKRSKARAEKALQRWSNFFLCVLIFLLLGYGVKRIGDAADVVSLLNPEVAAGPGAELVGLDGYRFEINQVTRLIRAEFSLANRSAVPVRDVLIDCDLLDKSGEHRGRGKWVIYDTLPAGSSQRYTIEDKRYISYMVTPDTIRCRVIDASPSATNVALVRSTEPH